MMRPFLEECRRVTRSCIAAISKVVKRCIISCKAMIYALHPKARERVTQDKSVDSATRVSRIRKIYRARKTFVVVVSALLCVLILIVAVSAFTGISNRHRAASTRAQSAISTSAASQSSTPTQTEESSASATQSSSGSSSVLTQQQRDNIAAQALKTAQASGKTLHQYRYCVSGKGNVGDTQVFENAVFSILNSTQGWPRAGATFEYIAHESSSSSSADSSTQCDMTLILAEASTMKSFSDGCSEDYSCRVNDEVIINLDRWNSATSDWLNAGGTVERYRKLVINHEVGHRLGHLDNEATCSVSGGPAPVMQQQSISLRGCSPNEWPLYSELWIS